MEFRRLAIGESGSPEADSPLATCTRLEQWQALLSVPNGIRLVPALMRQIPRPELACELPVIGHAAEREPTHFPRILL
jgi:hypothetical protein